MTESTQTLIGIGVAVAGLIWFLMPKVDFGKWFQSQPNSDVKPLPPMDRVEVFATLDAMREWFEQQNNQTGVEAMLAGSRALIEKGVDDA